MTKNRRLLGDLFLKSGKISYSQNDLENPLGRRRVRSQQSQFLSIGADCCQVCWLGHVVKDKLFLKNWPAFLYKKFISVHLKLCNSREMGTRMKSKQETAEGTADPVLSHVHSGHWHVTWNLGLRKQRRSSFIAFWYHLDVQCSSESHLIALSKKTILYINQKMHILKAFIGVSSKQNPSHQISLRECMDS